MNRILLRRFAGRGAPPIFPARVPAAFPAGLALAVMIATTAIPLPGWQGTAQAHPALEREPVAHHMKGPTARSARRAPLGAAPVKSYLPRKAGASSGVGSPVFQGLLGFYRNVISPVDGNRCVMAPTCSLYGHQAIQEHGVVMGIFLTADRLLHEGDEIPRVPTIVEAGEKLYVDTLEANTYWWPAWLK